MANIDAANNDMGSQMKLAGLVSEPTDVDPVSGNEIPLGATAEGVRDDETAAISPGEFVIPDYAVRYHGLDFYMESLQKATQGLQQMEQMGMVGNPDNATMSEQAPLPTMDTKDESLEFQTGGLTTTALPQITQQQVAPTTPLPQAPVVQPLRPISTQPIPALQLPKPYSPFSTTGQYQQPTAPLLTQYQQGYYRELTPGQYQFFAPPGQFATQGLVTIDQISDPSLIAPKNTKSSDVWGTTPPGAGFTKDVSQSPYGSLQSPYGSPQSQYLDLMGGTPGGYAVEQFTNESGNSIYLTTYGGKVQGGTPPGYRKVNTTPSTKARQISPRKASDSKLPEVGTAAKV